MDQNTLTFISLFGELLLLAIGFLLWNKIQGNSDSIKDHEIRITTNTQAIALNSQRDELLMAMVERELKVIAESLKEIKDRLKSLEDLEKQRLTS